MKVVALVGGVGGARFLQGLKHIGADVNLAFPDAEIAVMGPAGAVNIMHRQELAAATDAEALRQKLVSEYREQFANPFKAAELGFIDEVIRPKDARRRLAECLRLLENKRDQGPRRKHGNIPL